MDRGAWQATVHGVANSQTWLNDWVDRTLDWLSKTRLSRQDKTLERWGDRPRSLCWQVAEPGSPPVYLAPAMSEITMKNMLKAIWTACWFPTMDLYFWFAWWSFSLPLGRLPSIKLISVVITKCRIIKSKLLKMCTYNLERKKGKEFKKKHRRTQEMQTLASWRRVITVKLAHWVTVEWMNVNISSEWVRNEWAGCTCLVLLHFLQALICNSPGFFFF